MKNRLFIFTAQYCHVLFAFSTLPVDTASTAAPVRATDGDPTLPGLQFRHRTTIDQIFCAPANPAQIQFHLFGGTSQMIDG